MIGPQRLWAPWRGTFLRQRKPRHCIFCRAKRARRDRAHHVLARGVQAFVMLNLYPYTNGHLMIIPYRHVGRFEKIRPEEWAEMLTLGQEFLRRLRRTVRPHGYNLGLNLGRVAGAGIPGHLHLHIVPRWTGDTNVMPVLANTRIISQSLDELYTLLTKPRRPS